MKFIRQLVWYRVPTEFVPIRNRVRKDSLWQPCISPARPETAFRARSVTGTRHSVTVADAGSNPAGSILPVVEEKFHLRREGRDISSSNLTQMCGSPILIWTECPTLRFLKWSRFRGAICFLGAF